MPAYELTGQTALLSQQLLSQRARCSSYQQQQVQLVGQLAEDTTMDAQRTLAFAVHTAAVCTVLTSAQKQAFAKDMQAGGGIQGVYSIQTGGCAAGALIDLGSRTSTPTPLEQAPITGAGHTYSIQNRTSSRYGPVQGRPYACSSGALQQQQVGHLDDSTSPLSSNSFAMVGGVPTPQGVEAVSAARVGCKRSYGTLEQQHKQYQQVLQLKPVPQQTVLLGHRQHQQRSSYMKTDLLQQTTQQCLLQQQQQSRHVYASKPDVAVSVSLLQQQQLARQHALQQQRAKQQQQLEALLARERKAAADAASACAVVDRVFGVVQQQQVLQPQFSGSSVSSSCSTAFTAAADSVWQQLVQQQQEQKQFLAAASAEAPQQAPRLGSASSITTTSSSSTSSAASIFANYLQHQQIQPLSHQQQQQQRPVKRAATEAAVAALLSATAATQVRTQQQRALLQPLVAVGSSNSLHSLTAMQSAAAAVGPYRSLPSTRESSLLTWAGQVLHCQLQDAYHLASHLFKRVASKLDDMLLISLGITLPADTVSMLISLWVATKLEGHRRQVAGCSRLANALQLQLWAVTTVELHIMQLLNWEPYAGWSLRSQESPSCIVAEY